MAEAKSKFILPVIATVAVLAGGIGAYIFFKGGPSGDASGALNSAKVVPNKALMATYITTDPEAWSKLEQFGSNEAQKITSQALANLNKDFFGSSNIEYEKDIKPWVGGVMIALLPPSEIKPVQSTQSEPSKTITTQPPQPNFLMVVGIKDKISALNFANKLKQQKGVSQKEIDYQGEKITETTDKGTSTYSSILNNSYIVFAPEKKAVEQAIDAYKGESSFATKEGANAILSRGLNLENTLAQVYVPDYARMTEEFVKSNPQAAPLTPQALTQLKQVKSVVAGVGVDDAGIRVKALANLDDKLTKFKYESTGARVISQFPSETIALVNGQGISRWWSAVTEQSKDYPDFKQILEQARAQSKQGNIDLDKEIFGWMDGEFGIGIVQSNQGLLAGLGFGGALVFDTSDRKTAESTLAKLDNIIKSQQINVAQKDIGGKKVTEWQTPQGGLFAHGWLDNDTVFLALGGPIAEAIAAPKNQSLENSPNFKAVTDSLQKPNGGYFYLDMDKTIPLITRFSSLQGQPLPPEASVILNSIRGMGVTAYSPDKSVTQMEMLLALKPKAAK